MDSANQDINLNSPNKGLVVAEAPDLPTEGAAGAAGFTSGLTYEEEEELRVELAKVEDEILTLRQVLSAKERHVSEIKRRLGLSPLEELKQNLSRGWQDVQSSTAYGRTAETLGEWNQRVTSSDLYKRTQETLTQAGQKTSAALSTVGTAISRKLGDMSGGYGIRHSISMPVMRNSPSFRSFEDKVGNLKAFTATTLKVRSTQIKPDHAYKMVGRGANGEDSNPPTN